MLKIRLARRGAVHRPFYRVVVNNSTLTPDARNVEEIGIYDPRQSPAVLMLDVEKAEGWIKKGAIPSPRVKAFIKRVKTKGQSPARSAAPRTETAPAGEAPAEAPAPAEPVAGTAPEPAAATPEAAPPETPPEPKADEAGQAAGDEEKSS